MPNHLVAFDGIDHNGVWHPTPSNQTSGRQSILGVLQYNLNLETGRVGSAASGPRETEEITKSLPMLRLASRMR